MTNRKLPPLNALRYFEAVAKYGSMTKAAEKLNVSPPAVKQQINLLEAYFKKAIFTKTAKGSDLTEYGKSVFPKVRKILDLLEDLQFKNTPDALNINVLGSFARSWLSLRLSDFYKKHPNIEVNIKSDARLADFQLTNTDLAIRYGRGKYTDLVAELLNEEILYPVASVDYFEKIKIDWQRKNFDNINFLWDVPLLGDEDTEWDIWFRENNYHVPIKNKITYDDTSLIIDAVKSGLGVMMTRHSLVADDIAEGRLMRLDEKDYQMRTGNYLVYPSFSQLSNSAKAFRMWLIVEMNASL